MAKRNTRTDSTQAQNATQHSPQPSTDPTVVLPVDADFAFPYDDVLGVDMPSQDTSKRHNGIHPLLASTLASWPTDTWQESIPQYITTVLGYVDAGSITLDNAYAALQDKIRSFCHSVEEKEQYEHYLKQLFLYSLNKTEAEEDIEHSLKLDEKAFYGLSGDIVKVIEPFTEASSAAILIQLLATFGIAVGRNTYFTVEADKHYTNIYVCLVGNTARGGRKGTSLGIIKRIFESIDPAFKYNNIKSGLSSGEGIIQAVRDRHAVYDPDGNEKVIDEGVLDKRVLFVEAEFSSVLVQDRRQGNILSQVIRSAWDDGNLQTVTRRNSLLATDAHIGITWHITPKKLQQHFNDVQAANGFGNRFLWFYVQRSQRLPLGGSYPEYELSPYLQSLQEALRIGQEYKYAKVALERDREAELLWCSYYNSLSDPDSESVFESMCGREDTQVLRLSIIYALLDKSRIIRKEHVEAAIAIQKYAKESARFLWEDTTGTTIDDKLYKELALKPQGMTKSEITKGLFQRNVLREEIDAALERLTQQGLITAQVERTHKRGKATERWYATHHT